MMKRRWYDLDPTLSLAISLIWNSDEETKSYCAKIITETLQAHNIQMDSGFGQLIKEFKRWYDDNKELSAAMDYLKEAPEELKRIIALDIIEHLQTSETK